VYVEKGDSADTPVVSWQGSSERPQNDTGVTADKNIVIHGGSKPEEDSAQEAAQTETLQESTEETQMKAAEQPTSTQIVQVGDGVQGAKISIENVNTTGTTDAAIEIGDNADVDLQITDTTIKNAQDDGISIGANSNVDITFAGENTYSAAADAQDTAGIRVADSGTTAQTTAPRTDETQTDGNGTEQEETTTETESGPAVTLTGDGTDASFTVTGADVGLSVGQNSTVVIGGDVSRETEESAESPKQQESNQSEASTAPQQAESDLKLVLKDNTTGVENNGDLTITGGTEVEIASSDKAALSATGGSTTTLDGDATVTIEKGKNTGDEIALADGAKLTVADATLEAEKVSLKNGSGIEIQNDAKVVANQIVDESAISTTERNSSLVITGGTLELTGSKSGETPLASSMTPGLNADNQETLDTQVQKNIRKEYGIWPTNGSTHWSEYLVNFQLTADETHSLFNVLDKMGTEYQYSVDLDKYADGETLSVWVPVVLLDYYFRDDLPEDTSFADMTEDEVRALLQETLYRDGAQDAVIRGQSLQFATLKGHTTGNVEEEGKTWYYYQQTTTGEIDDGTVEDAVQVQTGQWLVFSEDTPVTGTQMSLYAFSSEHFGETNADGTDDTDAAETEKRDDTSADDWEDDLDDISASTGLTLGTFNLFGALGNRGSTSGTAALGEVSKQPDQTEAGESPAQTAGQQEADGRGEIHETEAYAAAGGVKTGDATPMWGVCALLAACGLAASAWCGKKRRAPCRH
jgi:hypothetical protein